MINPEGKASDVVEIFEHLAGRNGTATINLETNGDGDSTYLLHFESTKDARQFRKIGIGPKDFQRLLTEICCRTVAIDAKSFKQKERVEGSVTMLCDSDETKQVVANALGRITSLMSAFLTYSANVDKLDDDFTDKEMMDVLATPFLRFNETLVALYPHGPEQLEADIRAFGNFKVR